MIGPDKRNAIYQLHQEGMSLREISRRLHVSRSAVRAIVKQQGKIERQPRSDKKQIDAELLERLYHECDGWVQRIHEKLVEEEGVEVGYSTLTRLLRELELGGRRSARCDRVPDEPGAEMQHDTTVYRVKLGEQWIRLIASLIYLRYSKRRYLKFYRVFNRFAMKCFLHEALMFWGYAAWRCIIDNTNLARLRGAGSSAVIVPEMQAFSKHYGFQFVCHAINHPNRKAGNERSFWSVETNFLRGRSFESLEDLNQQAKQWATERMEHRPLTKARLIPAKMFEHERLYLNALPRHLPAPYQEHQRGTDQYGYVAFRANYYWVPGTRRDDVRLLEYADHLKIFRRYDCLAEYPLPPDGVRAQHYSPPGQPQPRYQSKKRRRDAKLEEQRLRALGDEVSAYLDFALKAPGIQRHRFTRELFALSRKLTRGVLIKTAQRALRYRCRDYLFSLRWPEGFECPRCGGDTCWNASRGRLVCGSCRHQTTVTAGTIFEGTRKPLRLWFRAIWQIVSQRNGASAIAVQEALGLRSYQTAWTWLHKLRRAMVRPGRDKLSGVVEVDETFIGGEDPKDGTWVERKSLVVIATEEDGNGIGRIRLRTIPTNTKKHLHSFIQDVIESGSVVHTDGSHAYLGIDTLGYEHRRTVLLFAI